MAVKLTGTPIASGAVEDAHRVYDGVWSTDPTSNIWFDGNYTNIKDISWIGLLFNDPLKVKVTQIKYCTRGGPPTSSPSSLRFQVNIDNIWTDIHTFNAGPGGISVSSPTVNTVDIPSYTSISNQIRVIANADVGTGYGLLFGELEFWGEEFWGEEFGVEYSHHVSTPVILSTMPHALTRGFR